VIRAGNEKGAHAHDSVANDVLLLPSLKAFTLCIHSVHATRNSWCLLYWQHCGSHRQQFSSPRYSLHPPHRLRHTHHTVGVISWFAIYKCARFSCGFRLHWKLGLCVRIDMARFKMCYLHTLVIFFPPIHQGRPARRVSGASLYEAS